MPDRILREGLLRSNAWNNVSGDAQMLFIRLLLVADDFGCFDGREQVIISQCYVLNPFEPAAEFPPLLAELHREDLILRYSNRARPFIAIRQWAHDFRYKRRYPAPPINIDVRGCKYRGKYGKEIEWQNPEGSDEVSVLIGFDGRAVAPQPPEWRRLSDYAPVTWKVSDKKTVTAGAASVTGAQSLERAPQSLVTSASPLLKDLETLRLSNLETSAALEASKAPVTAKQSLQPPSPTSGNGKLELSAEGEWRGLTEAQRLRWQDMFPGMSIPDQLARAAAWLQANETERKAYEAQDGLEAYLIRWLLREGRTHAAYKGAH